VIVIISWVEKHTKNILKIDRIVYNNLYHVYTIIYSNLYIVYKYIRTKIFYLSDDRKFCVKLINSELFCN